MSAWAYPRPPRGWGWNRPRQRPCACLARLPMSNTHSGYHGTWAAFRLAIAAPTAIPVGQVVPSQPPSADVAVGPLKSDSKRGMQWGKRRL